MSEFVPSPSHSGNNTARNIKYYSVAASSKHPGCHSPEQTKPHKVKVLKPMFN